MAEQLGVLEEMRDEGKLDLIGVSNVSLEQLEQAIELIELGEVQNPFNVIDRGEEPLVELCRERGIAFVPFFPIGSAFTGGPTGARRGSGDRRRRAPARRHARADRARLAARLYDRILLIPGHVSVAHLEENMAAAEIELDDEDMAALEQAVEHGAPH